MAFQYSNVQDFEWLSADELFLFRQHSGSLFQLNETRPDHLRYLIYSPIPVQQAPLNSFLTPFQCTLYQHCRCAKYEHQMVRCALCL